MSRPVVYGLLLLVAIAAVLIIRYRINRVNSPFKYFSWSEFDSPDAPGSGKQYMNPAFIRMLDAIREEVGFPLVISSGYRTPAHNAKVGGVPDSAHTKGVAVDITAITDGQKRAIAKAAIRQGITRIGWGRSFIHLDIDASKPQNVAWSYPGSIAPSISSLA